MESSLLVAPCTVPESNGMKKMMQQGACQAMKSQKSAPWKMKPIQNIFLKRCKKWKMHSDCYHPN
eukprot:14931869-Ditylum_brightwellii.AAC.1